MFFAGWAFSGLLASSIAYSLYPKELSSSPNAVIILVLFLLLGSLDYITTAVGKKGRHGIKFRI